MPHLEFELRQQSSIKKQIVNINQVIIAGWTGRDQNLVQHHIDELGALGVPAPSAVPLYYRVSNGLLTQADQVQVLGPASSGEIEPVLFATEEGIWLTIGSDHTDRDVEQAGVALSKQLCVKPVARTAWRYDEVDGLADNMLLKSFINGQDTYQQGSLEDILPLSTLLNELENRYGHGLLPGMMMFCGTLPTVSGIQPSNHFSGLLLDPSAGRTITMEYNVEFLPIVS